MKISGILTIALALVNNCNGMTTPNDEELVPDFTIPTEELPPTVDEDSILDEHNVPIDLSEDEKDKLVDLPICPEHNDWSFKITCYNPKEDISCKVYQDKPLCKCPEKFVCTSRGTHNTGSDGVVPCVYMCKSPAQIEAERDDAHKYEMGLLLNGKKK